MNHFYFRTCLQFWAAYVPCESQHLNAVQLTLEQIDLIKRLIDKYEQHLQFASSAKGKKKISTGL
jgi:membrane dipeptidase